MVDRYKMIIWSKSREESLEEQVNRAYEILTKLNKYEQFKPNFLPARSKKDVCKFELTKENVKRLIIEKQDKKFPVLGSELSFFSSMNEKESSGINFSVGKSNPDFYNSMIINLPINFTIENLCSCINLFKELVKSYDSYYACITSNFNLNLYNDWYNYNMNIPKTIFWMNYWGEDILNILRLTKNVRIGKIDKLYEIEEYHKGYFLRLQENPIDMNNEKDINFQKEINTIFF